MIVDQELRVNNGETVRASDPDYSGSIDLTISPIVGNGTEIYAVIVVDTYTQGTSSGTDFSVVTSSATDFSADVRKIGTVSLTNTELEARDDDANKQPIVIKINPDQDTTALVSSATARYLGIQYNHVSTAPTVMTVTAYFVTNYQSEPTHGFHASGSTIL